ncbi:MAG: molybdenum cofactor guanylyltransferase MobA, partial [Pseudomonadota bacterium]
EKAVNEAKIVELRLAADRRALRHQIDTARSRLDEVEHVLARFSPQVGQLAISANRNLSEYARFDYPVLEDETQNFDGPLAGIKAGLAWCPTPILAVVACDSPNLPINLVSTLRDALENDDAEISVARAGGKRQPVFVLLKSSLLTSLEEFLLSGERKIGKWYDLHRTVETEFSEDKEFANINTEDERISLEKTL